MTIPLTGAGSLGVRIGHFLGGSLDMLALEGATATARVLSGASMVTRVGTIITDAQAGTPDSSVVDGIFTTLSSWQNSQSSLFSAFKTYMQNTFISMVNTDVPLSSLTLANALAALNTQMLAGGTTWNASVPSAGTQTNVGTPIGNPIVIVTVKNGNGTTLQFMLPETLTFTCTQDSVTGSATAGRETVQVAGAAAQNNVFSYNWPLGSGSSSSLTAVDGAQSNNSAGNLLVNSDFPTFTTANYPDNWVALVGVVGTDIKNGTTSNAYTTGGGSLQFVGDGVTLPAIYQQFNHSTSTSSGSGGTPALLKPDTVYHVNGWVKCSATPSTGILQLSLIDSTNTIINDDAGTANAFTKSLTAVSTSFVNFNGSFRTPANPPSTMRLRIRTSTAIESGKSAYIGRVSMATASSLYTGGPWITIHSGNVAMLKTDSWTLAVAQVWGVFMREFQRYFNFGGNGYTLPVTTSSPTIADSLVT